MSIGPMGGLPASAAGVPLAQAKGAEVDRAHHEIAARQRQACYDEKADAAAGVGETDGEDHETADRDADGRLPWTPASKADQTAAELPRKSRDASGQAGNLLDLIG